MSSTKTFTTLQAEILTALLEMTPQRWRSAVNKQLEGTPTYEQLNVIIAKLNESIAFLDDMRAELPPEHLLAAYFDHTKWPQDGVDNKVAWVHDHETGSLAGLRLPGGDVEQMVRGLYTNLAALIAIGPELLKLATARLDGAALFPGKEDQTPFQEIGALPSMVTQDQKLQLAKVLTEKNGEIDLSGMSKVDASFIVTVLNERLRRCSGDLSTDERRKVTTKFDDGEFGWVSPGTRGGREQDQAAHLNRSANSKPSPSLSAWHSSLPE